LPDKAIDLIDEAGSRVRMYKAPYAANLRETFVSLKKLQKEKNRRWIMQRFDDAIDLRYREVELEAINGSASCARAGTKRPTARK
jgi:ATP-dependent Clp protease ATP-binding subunit ClpC